MWENLYYNNPAFRSSYQPLDQNNLFGQPYGSQVPGMTVNPNRRSGFGFRAPDMSKTFQVPGMSLNPNRRELPEQPTQSTGGFDAGKAMNYAEIGLGGYEQGRAGTTDFSIDPNAGFKGSGAGLMKGGVVGAIAGGIAAQIGTFSEANKNLRNLDTSIQGVQYDAYGRPMYHGSEFLTAQNNIDALNKGERSIKRTIDPATRVFSGLFGTRKKIRRKRRELNRNLRAGQQSYNQQAEQYNASQTARNAYYDSFNRDERLYNLYNR
jgi:hypothetical protein